MTEIPFEYSTDPETREITRQYADGAAFVAVGPKPALAFWARHPQVQRLKETIDGDGYATVRIWLKGPLEEAEGFPEKPPGGASDLSFYGPGKMRGDFWATHPDIATYELVNFYGDDSMDDDGWNVNVWLRGD